MTTDRTAAYTEIIFRLRQLKPAKFTEHQMNEFIETLDDLLWATELTGAVAERLDGVCSFVDELVAGDRLAEHTGEKLKRGIRAVGPQAEDAEPEAEPALAGAGA